MDAIMIATGIIITALGFAYGAYIVSELKYDGIPAGLLFPTIRRKENTAHFWITASINYIITTLVLLIGIFLSIRGIFY